MQNMVYDVRDILTFRDLISGSAQAFRDRTAFLFHEGKDIREISYREAYGHMRALAAYLLSLGLENKKIAVMGKNGYPWALSYLAVTCGVGVVVPIDRELKTEELSYITSDAEISAILYTPDVQDKIDALPGDFLKLSTASLEEYLRLGEELLESGDTSYDAHKTDPTAMGILLYTSGTTGLAKGVMLSQYNICSDIMHVMRRIRLSEEDRVLSVLPLHHTYECTAGFLAPLYIGASIAYNDSLHRIQSDFKTFRPTIFIGVPLILEKLRAVIVKKYAQIRGGTAVLALQRKLSDLSGRASSPMAKKIFSTVSEAFGGRLKLILCGAALLPADVFTDLERFGFKVYIGYGLTETSPVCLMHNDFYRAPDDIGYPIPGCRAMLADVDENGVGELAVSGSNVMLGYYKNPEETARVLRDGWFYTGDLATQKPNGAYKITGRKKSMIVTQNGKKIFPEELEFYLSGSPLVAECMVYGEQGQGDVTVTAAVFPNYEELDKRLAAEGITPEDSAYMERVQAAVMDVVRQTNEKLPSFRRIMKVVVRKTEFEKTTTRKIKRAAEENRSGDTV